MTPTERSLRRWAKLHQAAQHADQLRAALALILRLETAGAMREVAARALEDKVPP